MNNIKSFIKGVLPYTIIKAHYKKINEANSLTFNLDSKGNIESEDSKYKNFVTTIGFGYSGHSAVLDLLKEYSNTDEFCDKYFRHYELDFIRHSGGLFEIERSIGSNNQFINDALLHRTISLFEKSAFLSYSERAKMLTSIFLSSIIDYRIEGIKGLAFNPHLQDIENPSDIIYYLKNINKEDYIKLCRNYIIALFNCFYEKGKDTLVLNHLFTDGDLDMLHNSKYLPNVKTIIMYRDPRDVYAQALINNVQWIPKDEIGKYIKWYKNSVRNFNPKDSSFFALSFGELICNYEETVARLESYIGLDKSMHVDKFKYLDPSKSIKNVNLWKQLQGKEYELNLIKEQLGDYLFLKE